MTNKEREKVIDIAIRDYKAAVNTGDRARIEHCVNMMENTFLMCSIWGTKGISELRHLIMEARGKEKQK